MSLDRPLRFRRSVLIALPILRTLVWPLVTLLGPFIVKNRRQIPKSGGLLILANHISDFDPVLVQLACPRPVHFMAKSELFQMPILGKLITWYGAFPVRRGEPDRASLERAIELLRAGEVVCIFPEGRLSRTGELLPLNPGAALVARKGKAALICVGIQGANRIIPFGKYVPRPAFRRVFARWGAAIPADQMNSAQEILSWAESELKELSQ